MRSSIVRVPVLIVALWFGVTAVSAAVVADAGEPAKPAESPKTDKPEEAKPKADEVKKEEGKADPAEAAKDAADAKDDDGKKDGADEAATKTPAKRLTPVEQKMATAAVLHAKVKKAKEKIPALETKINEKIGKLTDGARQPVEPRTLQRELQDKNPSMAARAFKKLTLQLVSAHESVKSGLMNVLKQYLAVAKMKKIDEDLKAKAEAEAAAVKEECIEVLTTLASLYERIAMEKNVTLCYRQILAIDKANAAAKTYFKELREKKKAASSGGSGGYSGTPRPDTGRRR